MENYKNENLIKYLRKKKGLRLLILGLSPFNLLIYFVAVDYKTSTMVTLSSSVAKLTTVGSISSSGASSMLSS